MNLDLEDTIATDAACVLVVEDDAAVAKLERLQLEEGGYRVFVAATFAEVIDVLATHRVDLMLLDIRLADGLHGLDVYSRVRSAGYEIPAILVTGLYDEQVLIRAMRCGVRDVVPKASEFLEFLLGVIKRVLDQIRIERRLVESETRLASIIGSVIDAIVVAGPDLKISLMNAAAERMFRCPATEAIHRPLSDFLPAELLAVLPGPRGSSVTPLPSRLSETLYGRRRDGTQFPIEASLSRTEAGGRMFLTAVIRDITERERATAKIREQAALLDQANDAITVRDTHGRIVYWNQGAVRLYGWNAHEVMGSGPPGTLSPASFLAFREAHPVFARTGEWEGEVRHIKKNCEEVIVMSRWSVLRGRGGQQKGILVIDSDTTEQKRLEAQYLHAQKMETVGTLAGGVAHDFNNLLTVILASSEILLTRPDLSDDESREIVASVHRAGERGATLVRQLLAFSRQQSALPRVLDLNQVVREAERMLRRLIGVDAELIADLDPHQVLAKIDPGQLEQVIVNLVVNARDAMPAGGRVTIKTQNVTIGSHPPAQQPRLHGECVMISVRDTGHGMDEQTRLRAFEPFFTTKEIGAGTGLGLSTVHGIVQQAGGVVTLETQPKKGTTLSVYLPRATDGPPTDSALRSVEIPKGTETVLVAEDDHDVRETIVMTLRANGYTVLEATQGTEALEIARSYPSPLHLLIADVVMPKMRGTELADRLNELRPGIKVLLLSGYTRLGALGNLPVGTSVAFLQKPFSRTSLAQKVRRVLDSPHNGS